MNDVTKVVEELGRAFEEFKAAHAQQLAEIKSGRGNEAVLNDKIEKIGLRMDELQAQKDELEKRFNRPLLDGKTQGDAQVETKAFNDYRRTFVPSAADIGVDEYVNYKGAFWQFVRKGNVDRLTADERKSLTAGVDSEGGFLLPAPTVGQIATKLWDLSPIRQIANVQPISGPALEGVVDNDEAAYGWVGETGARTATNTPAVGKYRIEAFEMYAAPQATQSLLDDAAVDVETWLANKIADKMARVEGAAFCVGTGVNQPRGFAAYTTAATADATRAWGTLEHVKTGANGAFHTTQADPLFDLIGAFKSGYLQNAKWVTRRSVIAAIRKFKTTTTLEYIWQPGLQQGQPQVILGYPVVIAEDMPALATGSNSMALGDFATGYQIVDRMGIRTLRDPYTNKPYIVFYSTKRVGGGVVNFEAIKFINFAA